MSTEAMKLPLFIITGASGTGKTTVVPALRKLLPEYDVFETDVIYDSVGDWDKVKNIWVRIASEIAKSGRMTILCGTMMPWDVEKCDDYPAFSKIHFLNFHCDDETRESRLLERGWSEEVIQDHKQFAKWLLENADKAYEPPMPTVDTSDKDVEAVAMEVKDWLNSRVGVK